MKIVIDQTFLRTDLAGFVEAYFAEDFNQGVAAELGLKERRLLEEETLAGGLVRRRVRMVPAVQLPKPVRALIGNAEISYDEVSVFDTAKNEVRYFIDSAARDRVEVKGVIRFIPTDGGVRRCIEGEAHVKVFGLGSVIERLIEAEVTKSYDKIAVYMQRYLDDKRQASFSTEAP